MNPAAVILLLEMANRALAKENEELRTLLEKLQKEKRQ